MGHVGRIRGVIFRGMQKDWRKGSVGLGDMQGN